LTSVNRIHWQLDYELPFGEGHRFIQRGPLSHVLDGWQWSGDFTVDPDFTFRRAFSVNSLDINRRRECSLRAEFDGAPVSWSRRPSLEWFTPRFLFSELPRTRAKVKSGSYGESPLHCQPSKTWRERPTLNNRWPSPKGSS